MGGKWSITARNADDKIYSVCDYNLSLFKFICLGIYCLFKYEIVQLGKHG